MLEFACWHTFCSCRSNSNENARRALMRLISAYAALALALLICAPAAGSGTRSATLGVTAHVVNSVPVVRLMDEYGKVLTHAEGIAQPKANLEKSILYLVVEY